VGRSPDTWVSTTKMPLGGAGGNAVGTFGISRDITERKQAEEALALQTAILKASETRFRALGEWPGGHFLHRPARARHLPQDSCSRSSADGRGSSRRRLPAVPSTRRPARVMAELAQVPSRGNPGARSTLPAARRHRHLVLVQSVIERDYAGV